MKRHVQETGIRKWFGDDLIELQSQPMKAIDEIFKPYSSCVISGCEVVNDTISPGLIAFVWDTAGVRNAKVVPFAGAAGIAVWPQYLYLQETPVTREYQGGGVKNIAMDCKAAIVSVLPVEPFIRMLATGPEKTFRDVIQSSAFRFITDAERTAWNAKANANNPVFTGNVQGVTAAHVGLDNVTNESKATMFNNPVFTGIVQGVTKAHVGLGNVTNNAQWHAGSHPTTIAGYGITDIPTSLPASDVYAWAKAANKPGYSKAEIGLGNVDNTSDNNKPISLAVQAALDLKAPLSNPSFSTNVTINGNAVGNTALSLKNTYTGDSETQINAYFKSTAWGNTLGGQISLIAGAYSAITDFVYRSHDTNESSSTAMVERFRIYGNGDGRLQGTLSVADIIIR
jgi:hypothetical protein